MTTPDLTWLPTERIIDGLRYSTADATAIVAGNGKDYFCHVFRTQGGRYFILAKRDPGYWKIGEYPAHTGNIEPISVEGAVRLWQKLTWADRLPFADAFPDYAVVPA